MSVSNDRRNTGTKAIHEIDHFIEQAAYLK